MTPHRGPPPAHQEFADEVALQRAVLWRERYLRLAFNNLAFALTTIFIPVWVAVIAAIANLVLEFLPMLAMARLKRPDQRLRRAVIWLSTFLLEFCYVLLAAIIWQGGDDLARPFAIGMVMTTLLHISTERGIHLPFGIAAISGAATATLGGNAWLWLGLGDYDALALSTLCALGGLGYALTAMLSTNSLQRETAAARRAAQAGEQAQTRFLAMMSHELRTPLNAILGMGRTELARSADALAQERLSLLVSSAEGLQVILDDALDFAAIQDGRLALRPRPGIPAQAIRAAADLFAEDLRRSGLTLDLAIAPELDARALLDSHRLRQCLINLLSNAVKYAGAGRVRLHARTINRIDAAPLLRIEVADEGPGIAPARAAGIFEPFSGGGGIEPAQEAGLLRSTGLGLAISRALARQMGGDLELSPNQPRGAKFVLTLLLAPAPEGPLPAARAHQTLSGRRALVVDDILSNRLVAAAYLQALGMTVELAASGAEALAMIAASPPDVVLLDLQMPEMSGTETLSLLRRATAGGAHLPVIAMTAWEKFPTLPGMGGSVDATVPKPLDPDRLRDELLAVLDKPRGSRPD